MTKFSTRDGFKYIEKLKISQHKIPSNYPHIQK